MADPKTPYDVNLQNESVLEAGAASLLAKKGNKSAFNVLRYPSNLGTDEHPHYLMFFITVRESDISSGEVRADPAVQFDYSQNNTGVDKSAKTAQAGVAIVGGVAGGAIGGGFGAAVSDNSGFGKGAGAFITGGAALAGAVAGAKVGIELGDKAFQVKQKDQVTLKTAIALYMTGKPSVQYQANWADESLGIVGGLSSEVLRNIDPGNLSSIENIKSSLEGVGGGMGGGMASFILSKAESSGNIGGLGNAGAAFSAGAGVTANPFRAQLFKSMGFRKFSYEYVFLPKNFTEYNETQNIIRTFKTYMHPHFGTSKFILNYPAEFTIAYYWKDVMNRELYKISNCALTNLSIEYGGTDFTTFKETPGYPTEISMKLEFTELEVLSRERIEVGY